MIAMMCDIFVHSKRQLLVICCLWVTLVSIITKHLESDVLCGYITELMVLEHHLSQREVPSMWCHLGAERGDPLPP